MQQVGRTLTTAEDGVLRHHHVLICDRDRKWNEDTRRLLDDSGTYVVQTPYQAPTANAFAERFVRSIKEECLDRIIPIGDQHFRRAVHEFVEHYHRERNHQGLGNELIDRVDRRRSNGHIQRRQRLGGLLNYWRNSWLQSRDISNDVGCCQETRSPFRPREPALINR